MTSKQAGAVLMIVGVILAVVAGYLLEDADQPQPLIGGLFVAGALVSWLTGFVVATINAPDLGNF